MYSEKMKINFERRIAEYNLFRAIETPEQRENIELMYFLGIMDGVKIK